jgi:hypothetical protein
VVLEAASLSKGELGSSSEPSLSTCRITADRVHVDVLRRSTGMFPPGWPAADRGLRRDTRGRHASRIAHGMLRASPGTQRAWPRPMTHDTTPEQHTQTFRGIAADDLLTVNGSGGLAASQARYLELTARKSDLELQGQFNRGR